MSKPLDPLSADEVGELRALYLTTDALAAAGLLPVSFILRSHWPSYRRMVRRGLVTWGAPPYGFSRSWYAGTSITDAGRAALAEAERSA